jgi:hypothetical protein
MLKSINEWARDNNLNLGTIDDSGYTAGSGVGNVDGYSSSMEVLYDEDHVTAQVNDWIQKLIGLCSPVPKEDRAELTEQIVKAIRQHLQ